jgi:hypothetical protein
MPNRRPFTVIKQTSDRNVHIRHVDTGKEQHVHVQRLKKFNPRPVPSDSESDGDKENADPKLKIVPSQKPATEIVQNRLQEQKSVASHTPVIIDKRLTGEARNNWLNVHGRSLEQ